MSNAITKKIPKKGSDRKCNKGYTYNEIEKKCTLDAPVLHGIDPTLGVAYTTADSFSERYPRAGLATGPGLAKATRRKKMEIDNKKKSKKKVKK